MYIWEAISYLYLTSSSSSFHFIDYRALPYNLILKHHKMQLRCNIKDMSKLDFELAISLYLSLLLSLHFIIYSVLPSTLIHHKMCLRYTISKFDISSTSSFYCSSFTRLCLLLFYFYSYTSLDVCEIQYLISKNLSSSIYLSLVICPYLLL